MKIIYCINELHIQGGMGRVLVEKANYLSDKYGYEILVVTTEDRNKDLAYNLSKNIKKINIDLNYYGIGKKNKLLFKIVYFLKQRKHLRYLKKIIRLESPDIIISLGDIHTRYICNKVGENIVKILEAHFEKGNFLRKIRKNKIIYFLDIYRRVKEISIIKNYSKFIILTNEDKKEWLKERKIKNIEVIPNPLPFYPEKVSNCENKTIISVGRLEEQKGYDELIEVWSKLFQKYPEWKLEIYGEGSLRKKLQQKIDELGMGTSLLLSGNNKNIMDRYLESSIYVMTSKYEGMPMVLLETMACGLPVVSFDCPCGPKDIIKDGEDGYLIRNRNLDEMANKIEFLIQNESQRKIMGKKARENITRYSKDKVMLQWKNLFEELVNNKES